jgi:hypothetical protein
MSATYHTSPRETSKSPIAQRSTMPAPEAGPTDTTKRMAAYATKREMVRAVNEQIRLLAQPSGVTSADHTPVDFVCECPHETCFAVVPMTLTEWKAATSEVDYYVARPQHVLAGDQAVVATNRYTVVHSVGDEQAKQGLST